MTQAQADAIHDRYRKAFVGRSRATRDLSQLDAIIADTERLGALSGELGTTVSERLALYRTERKEIAEMQAGGPAVLSAWRKVEWSEVAFGQYRRNFAGQNRATRDLRLLRELSDEESARLAAIPAGLNARLDARREQLAANVRLFEGELVAIRDARSGLAPAEQVRVLATAANDQFAAWRRFFEGKQRMSRRPALLEGMVAALEEIHAGMVAVREMGIRNDAHAGNVSKVAERIAFFREEAQRIRQARLQVPTADIARALGDEANVVFEEYRKGYSGKPRASADPAKLAELCDRLHETARAMATLQAERPNDRTARNLEIVLDHLRMMEREHTAIVEARGKKR